MAMKLIRKSFHDSLCLLIRGSKTAVKKQDVAMHATPTDPAPQPVWRGYSKYGSTGPFCHLHKALK